MSGYVPKKLRQRGATTKSAASTPTNRKPAATSATKRKPAPAATVKIPTQRRGDRDGRRPSPHGRRPSPTPPRRPSKRRRTVRQLQWLMMKLAIGAAVAILLAGGSIWGSQTINSTADTKAAVKAAETAAAALFSYDYRDFDASIANGAAHATGAFAEDYQTTTEGLRESVETEQARIVADVVDVALLNSTVTFTDKAGTEYPRAVEVLAFVDHIITNADIEGSQVDQTRVIMTMVHEDGKWLAVHAKSL